MHEAYIIYNVEGIYIGHQMSQVVKGQVSTRTRYPGPLAYHEPVPALYPLSY